MARSSDDPEIERRIAHYHSSYPLEPDCHPLILARQVADWKDIVGERDWLDSSPAERLLRKQAADRALYLDDDGVLEADVVPRTRFDLIPEDGLANWALVRRELAHKIRIRVDRVKRGLVVPRSPTVKG